MLKLLIFKPRAAGGLGLTLLATLAISQVAQASTIHACVKPESGATRIVGAKAKCRHGEHKLSWNTSGPRGASGAQGAAGLQGAQGAEGKAGANGSGTSFEVTAPTVELPTASTTTVVTKVLPPGTFVLAAKTVLVATSGAAGFAETVCELKDMPGTSGSSEGTIEDAGAWIAPLAEKKAGEFIADSTLGAEGKLTSTVTSTLTFVCINAGTTVLSAVATRAHALTVTAIS